MLQDFQDHIRGKNLFNKNERLLLAVSGGVDSTVLAHLLKMHGYDLSLAHCNFGLRGKDSEDDESFCIDLASGLGIRIHTRRFNVEEHCRTRGISVQMAARELRYAWFKELLGEHGYNYILTAHHADDQAETILINLCRGTGIRGLRGMQYKSGNLVRPLLPYSKNEILAFAAAQGIGYRSDKSNSEVKYRRNFIRHRIIPAFREIYPNFDRSIANSLQHFSQEAAIVAQFLDEKKKALCKTAGSETLIDKEVLLKEAFKEGILHHILRPLGFNKTQEEQILQCIQPGTESGKVFLSDKARVENGRKHLVISGLSAGPAEIKVSSLAELKNLSLFDTEEVQQFERPKKNELYVDPARLVFPLTIRSQKKGDRFRPFGMKGSKLLSDLFKDEKLGLVQKERCRLLVNGNNEIIWVIGLRSDERYRLCGTETKLIKLTLPDEQRTHI